jgi:predicted ferric reductase
MNKWIFMPLFLLFFACAPVLLAVAQEVPVRTTYQQAVVLTSVGAFGLMLGLFWLSRLMPKNTVKLNASATLRWHKYIGYLAGLFFLVHPVLMIARRFWVVESNPIDNLMLMIQSPRMLPGLIAWGLLIVLVVLAFFRNRFPAKLFRYLHGLLSILVVGLATWHVIAIGRHSNSAMSVFWLILAGGAMVALLVAYLPKPASANVQNNPGVPHESA